MITRWGAALLAGGLLFTACSGSDPDDPTGDLVRGAGAAVIDQGTVRVELRLEGVGEVIKVAGQMDFANRAIALSMNVPGLGMIDTMSSGSATYIRKTGEGWTRIERTGSVSDASTSGFSPLVDPKAVLEQVADASDITADGTEEIHGVRTTRYRGRVSLEKAMRAQGMTKAQIDAARQQNQGNDITTTVEVSVDDDGLARRVVTRMTDGIEVDVTMTMELLDFGAPVEIRLPRDDEVIRTESASTLEELQQLVGTVMLGDSDG